MPKNDSFARIKKSEVASGSETQLLGIWGRFWGVKEDLASAFFAEIDIGSGELLMTQTIVYEDSDQLDEFNPGVSLKGFRKLFDGKASGRDVPQATITQTETRLRKFLDDPDVHDQLREIIENQSDNELNDLFYDFMSNMISKGEFIYQINAQLTTQDSSKADASGSSSSSKSSSKSDGSDQKPGIPTQVVSSPMEGDFPSDLSAGDEIYVRVTGEKYVSQLPEEYQIEKSDKISGQILSTVKNTSSSPNLPSKFDGDAKDYWELDINFLGGESGQAFVHKDTHIKMDEGTEDSESTSIFSPMYLITSGIVLLLIIGLAYIIFGI